MTCSRDIVTFLGFSPYVTIYGKSRYEWSIVFDDVTLVVFQLSVIDSQARGSPIQEAMVSLEHGTHEQSHFMP